MSSPGYILVNNPDYPEIADDYRATFATARALVHECAHFRAGSEGERTIREEAIRTLQELREVMNNQFLGNTLQAYLVSAAVFFGVFGGLPIAKAIALRHLKVYRTQFFGHRLTLRRPA